MQIKCSFFAIACRAAAFSFLVAGTASLMQAQSPSISSPLKTTLFLASNSASANLGAASSSSSSSLDGAASAADDRLDLSLAALDSAQPPPRRRYGRPNYSSGNTNPDGSNKYTFMGGFGLTLPTGVTHKYDTPAWGLQFGGGRNFNKYFGVLAQFDYDHFGLQGATIANQEYLYNYPDYEGSNCTSEAQSLGYCVAGLDGNSHIWSFSLDPVYTINTQGSMGAYIVAGVGFYHKVTNFEEPQEEEECYFYCGEYLADANIDHYTSNAPGVNGGFGITWKFSQFGSERLYAEARYVLMLNSQRYGYTAANIATTNYNGYDAYPANSDRTTYIPVKFGIRF